MIKLDVDIQGKSFSNTYDPVLGQLQINVAKGEFVSIVGPSGTGKSTLLNMVAGLEPLESGAISYNNQKLEEKPTCKLSYIFQQPRLMPWLTVYENLRLVMPEVTDVEIESILKKVGLKGKSALYPNELSGGMQRRVSIARAFLISPDLLLLDEPFVSLDEPNAKRLRETLFDLWREHRTTVVFVTHDLNEAIQLSDRILFLSSAPGEIILDCEIDLPRPRLPEDIHFQNWKKQLLSQYPYLLEGKINKTGFESLFGGHI